MRLLHSLQHLMADMQSTCKGYSEHLQRDAGREVTSFTLAPHGGPAEHLHRTCRTPAQGSRLWGYFIHFSTSWRTCRTPAQDMQNTCKGHAEHLHREAGRQVTSFTLAPHGGHAEHLQRTCRTPAQDMQSTCKGHAEHLHRRQAVRLLH